MGDVRHSSVFVRAAFSFKKSADCVIMCPITHRQHAKQATPADDHSLGNRLYLGLRKKM